MGGNTTRSSSVDLRQKMALRFRKIAEVYNTYADKLHGKCEYSFDDLCWAWRATTEIVTDDSDKMNEKMKVRKRSS